MDNVPLDIEREVKPQLMHTGDTFAQSLRAAQVFAEHIVTRGVNITWRASRSGGHGELAAAVVKGELVIVNRVP